jgi:hypothetical protein
MLLLIICAVIMLAGISIWIGSIILKGRFERQSKLLLNGTKDISSQTFQYGQLTGLPAPVQRYFKYVLKEGQSYLSSIRLTHNGEFKTGFNKDWIKITGEHYATTEKPGFIWKGRTTMFTAQDMFVQDKGRLVVSLFSLYNIVDATGEKYDQGELLRWLGESVLYPTNMLPSDRLKWFAIDDTHARLEFKYNGIALFFILTFDEIGGVTQMETKRYMDDIHLETWIINPTHYKKMSDVIIPCRFEVLWRLKKGDFSYAKFNIQTVSFNEDVRVH